MVVDFDNEMHHMVSLSVVIMLEILVGMFNICSEEGRVFEKLVSARIVVVPLTAMSCSPDTLRKATAGTGFSP